MSYAGAGTVWQLGAYGEAGMRAGHAYGACLMDVVFCGHVSRGAMGSLNAVCAVWPFGLVGMHDLSVCMVLWGAGRYLGRLSGPVTR